MKKLKHSIIIPGVLDTNSIIKQLKIFNFTVLLNVL